MPTRARTALIGAAACAALLLLTWFAAFHLGYFKHVDQATFRGFFDLHEHSRIHSLASFVASLCNPNPYVYLASAPILIALVRRRPRLALVAAAILLGANVTTQLLKPLLAEPRPPLFGDLPPVAAASWPSGHATAAMSLALACTLVAGPRLRSAAAVLGAAFAVAVSYSFLTLGWHYPSDVFGGFLVAATWTLFAVGAMVASERRGPRVAPRAAKRMAIREALGPPGSALLAAVALAAIAVIARPHGVASYVRAHEAFVVGAAAIGVLAVALSTAVMLAVRR